MVTIVTDSTLTPPAYLTVTKCIHLYFILK